MSLFPTATMSADSAELLSDVCWYIALIGGALLIGGLIGEFPEFERWKKSALYKAAKAAVIVGVGGELFADAAIFKAAERIQELTNQSILVNVNAQKAMLQQLKARGFTREQFDSFVDAVKGKWKEVSVYTLTDTEAYFFGQAIMRAFQKADVKVNWMRPTDPTDVFMVPGIPTTGVHLLVSKDTPGFERLVQGFFNAFQKAGVTGSRLLLGILPALILHLAAVEAHGRDSAAGWRPRQATPYVVGMCGRSTYKLTWEEIVTLYRLTLDQPPVNTRARYNVCPTTTIDTIVATDGKRTLVPMRWGLVPSWWSKLLKELRLATFNARAETVAEKPFFRSAFRRTRCLIPVSGYYEWQDTARRQTAMVFHGAGRLAGVDGRRPMGRMARQGERRDIEVLHDDYHRAE